MPMFIRTPRNESVLRTVGPYPGSLNLLDRKQTAVQRAIRRGGLAHYEPATQATLLTLVQTSRRPAEFFDVGAHIGLYSALVGTIFPADIAHVTAFEPTPTTAAIARRLFDVNLVPAQLEPYALAAEEGTATLYISDKAETSNSLTAGFRESSEAVTVPKTTLDAYCLRRGVYPTVLKIDVETYESYVLQGAMQTLADARPSVVCELLPAAAPEPTRAVLDELDALGYHLHHWMDDHGWQESSRADVLAQTSHTLRDWLFTPGPLSDEFRDALHEWLDAIAGCTVEENLLVPGGERPPAGWGAPHRPVFQTHS